MMDTILFLYRNCKKAIASNVPVSDILSTGLFEKVIKMKYDIPNDKLEMFRVLNVEIEQTIKQLIKEI
jgi:V/A-type H+-transporting ATPase subunit A